MVAICNPIKVCKDDRILNVEDASLVENQVRITRNDVINETEASGNNVFLVVENRVNERTLCNIKAGIPA